MIRSNRMMPSRKQRGAFYKQFSEMLEETIRDYREKRISEKEHLNYVVDLGQMRFDLPPLLIVKPKQIRVHRLARNQLTSNLVNQNTVNSAPAGLRNNVRLDNVVAHAILDPLRRRAGEPCPRSGFDVFA